MGSVDVGTVIDADNMNDPFGLVNAVNHPVRPPAR
jgi:hypothetical protein